MAKIPVVFPFPSDLFYKAELRGEGFDVTGTSAEGRQVVAPFNGFVKKFKSRPVNLSASNKTLSGNMIYIMNKMGISQPVSDLVVLESASGDMTMVLDGIVMHEAAEGQAITAGGVLGLTSGWDTVRMTLFLRSQGKNVPVKSLQDPRLAWAYRSEKGLSDIPATLEKSSREIRSGVDKLLLYGALAAVAWVVFSKKKGRD